MIYYIYNKRQANQGNQMKNIVREILELIAFIIVLGAMAAGFVWADQKEHDLGIDGISSESVLIEDDVSGNR
jgi:hypothetical protein